MVLSFDITVLIILFIEICPRLRVTESKSDK